MPPRRCWREKGHHPREDSPPECRHRPKLHNSSTAAQTRMLSTGEFWARLGQPLACTSISSVVVVSAPTRRTTCLKLPSFRSRAACQVARSSSAKNLSSQNTLESQEFRRMFKRYLFGTTFASSSPLIPATQSGLAQPRCERQLRECLPGCRQHGGPTKETVKEAAPAK